MEQKRARKSKAKGDAGVREETAAIKAAKAGTTPPSVVKFLHLDILLRPYLSNMEDAELGSWDIRQAIIKYDNFVSEQVKRETVMHELLHVLLEHTNIDSEMHEDIIRALSPLLLALLRSNPQLLEYLAWGEPCP